MDKREALDEAEDSRERGFGNWMGTSEELLADDADVAANLSATMESWLTGILSLTVCSFDGARAF